MFKKQDEVLFHKMCKTVDAMEVSFLGGFRSNLQMDRLKVHQGILNTECSYNSGTENP